MENDDSIRKLRKSTTDFYFFLYFITLNKKDIHHNEQLIYIQDV